MREGWIGQEGKEGRSRRGGGIQGKALGETEIFLGHEILADSMTRHLPKFCTDTNDGISSHAVHI